MIQPHRHYPNDLAAWRLLLACLRSDEPAKQAVIHQLGGCARCWQSVARYLAYRIFRGDLPEGDRVEWVESRLLNLLDEVDMLDMLEALDDAA